MITACLASDHARARYALTALLRLLDLEWRPAREDEHCDIGYGAPGRCAIPIDATPEHWDDARPRVTTDGGLPIVHLRADRVAVEADDGLGFDVLYAAYACLTGPWERADPSDSVGAPIANEGWLASHGLLDKPLVHLYAQSLALALGVETPRRAAAVVLTHDVDRNFTHLFQRRESRALFRRDLAAPTAAARRAARLFARTVRPQRSDPNDRFEQWAALHDARSSRPAYFVASYGLFDPGSARQDVPYDIRHPEIAALLPRLADDGAEIGLHLSVNAHSDADRIRAERERLEEVVGVPVRSCRHHWWSLGRVPEQTLGRQAEAGLALDCSLGFNDRIGFRRGIAVPFRPFDPLRETELDIWELPTTVMDAAVDDVDRVADLWQTVRAIGAALVLDWHAHALNERALPGAAEHLAAILDVASADGAELRTPLELLEARV